MTTNNFIKFSEETLIDDFISEHNNKPLSNEFNYILSLTKTTKDEEELSSIENRTED